MKDRHSPHTQKFEYMLSDLNDHHNMRTKFVEGQDERYVKFDVWFGGLRNNLTVNVNLKGEVLMGKIHCVIDGNASKSDIESVLPEFAETGIYTSGEGNSTVNIMIQSTRSSKKMDSQEFLKYAKEIKSRLLDSKFVHDR